MAQALWNSYSNPGAFTSLATGHHLNKSVVPTGEPWTKEEDVGSESVPIQVTENDVKGKECAESGGDERRGEMKERDTTLVGSEEFRGDHVLARSASFMYEALVSKEVAQAVAEGDVGRVYEGIKVSTGSVISPFLTTHRR